MEQGSPEWFEARLGKVTASNLVNVLMKPSAAGFANYRAKLICERLTGTYEEGFTNAAMQNGKDLEDQARAFYEMETGNTVDLVGFIDHPTIPMTGASPDGLIGTDGNLELKCVSPAVHLAFIDGKMIDKKYRDQMLWQMECTQTAWTDFATFCPSFPPSMRLFVQRVPYDSKDATEARGKVTAFLADVSAAVKRLQERFPG